MDHLEKYFDQDVLSVIDDYYRSIKICDGCENEQLFVQCQMCYNTYCYACFHKTNYDKNCFECLNLYKISITFFPDDEIFLLLSNFFNLYMDGYFNQDLDDYYFQNSNHEVNEVYKKNKYIDDKNNLINRTLDIIKNYINDESSDEK